MYRDPNDPRNLESKRRYYERNKDLYYEKNKRRRQELRKWVDSLKSSPCTDCGVKYPPYVLEWDHIGTDKLFNVATCVSRMMSKQKVLDEIAKCELVCANCHRIRTWQRRNPP